MKSQWPLLTTTTRTTVKGHNVELTGAPLLARPVERRVGGTDAD